MTYAIQADLNNVFGATNISKWADLDNNGNAGNIAARIAFALGVADAQVNDRLRGSRYTVPFTTPPTQIIYAATLLAGIVLHNARGMEDAESPDPLSTHKKSVNDLLRRIRNGTLQLDVPDAVTTYPVVSTE